MQGIVGLQLMDIIFVVILQVCGYVGLVEEGVKMFELMGQEYGIKFKIEYYGCLVSFFGCVGWLKQVYEIIKNMEMEVDFVIWSFFLGSC